MLRPVRDAVIEREAPGGDRAVKAASTGTLISDAVGITSSSS